MPHTSPKPGDFQRQAPLPAPVTSGLIRQNGAAAVPADAALPSLLARWAETDALRERILVTNPAHLYRS
jgi:hypothetical protein